MARGNDQNDAYKEFREKYGEEPNAEQLLRMHRARQTELDRTLGRLPIDEAATRELDIDALAKQTDRKIVSAAVRGHGVSYVFDDDGDYRHGSITLDDLKGQKKVVDAAGDDTPADPEDDEGTAAVQARKTTTQKRSTKAEEK